MPDLPLYVVDAFTGPGLRGNPAGVCLLKEELPDAVMRKIAADLGHSETAFVRPLEGTPEKVPDFALRWFTPEVEVPLCGHATLATAAVLFGELRNPFTSLSFETKSGELLARRRDAGRIALSLPAETFSPAEASPAVLQALGAGKPLGSYLARMDRNLLLELSSEAEVRALKPDFARLKAAKGEEPFLGIIVTARGAGEYDFVSRYFAPWVGIDEDPVTGSAHCALGPFWAKRLAKTELRALQASPRGGAMTVRPADGRVELEGAAVVVSSGSLSLT
jgi:PhzF family phenazine biosynthesis protein